LGHNSSFEIWRGVGDEHENQMAAALFTDVFIGYSIGYNNTQNTDVNQAVGMTTFFAGLGLELIKEVSEEYINSNNELVRSAVKNGNTTKLLKHKNIVANGLKMSKNLTRLGAGLVYLSKANDAGYLSYNLIIGKKSKAKQNGLSLGVGLGVTALSGTSLGPR